MWPLCQATYPCCETVKSGARCHLETKNIPVARDQLSDVIAKPWCRYCHTRCDYERKQEKECTLCTLQAPKKLPIPEPSSPVTRAAPPEVTSVKVKGITTGSSKTDLFGGDDDDDDLFEAAKTADQKSVGALSDTIVALLTVFADKLWFSAPSSLCAICSQQVGCHGSPSFSILCHSDTVIIWYFCPFLDVIHPHCSRSPLSSSIIYPSFHQQSLYPIFSYYMSKILTFPFFW